ncbi:Ldh family oxidoreductase [Salinicola corii]|uniref:Ldh family oxidoreductase n=1 Tax=Salinicola corii TaxID=2606937 RepID=A0A640WEK0_9GAMM|nr:Ldh family oxidoreductase [Salinicola corii]KAA0018566.1 Ldh family oxidoreductase [Salinicola corii]
MSRRRLSIAQARELAMQALLGAGVGAREAGATSRALVAAECDGLSSHGLARLPFYLDQILSGKVAGGAVPEVQVSGSVVHVDAGHGLAFPAIASGATASCRWRRSWGSPLSRSGAPITSGWPVIRWSR